MTRHLLTRACIGLALCGAAGGTAAGGLVGPGTDEYVVFAYNDLGMHCMQQDFANFMILPPFNTLQALVIHRRPNDNPEIAGNEITLTYSIPSNTRSSDKTNWWTFDQDILGVDSPPDIGLTGNGMSGTMVYNSAEHRQHFATGIPLTPVDDSGVNNPYPLATVTAYHNGAVVAQTQTVVPVSWEISCALCHGDDSTPVFLDVLQDHDRLHGTTLEAEQPVFCAGCHADPALGAPGQAGVSSFSAAMHGAHADRMDPVPDSFITDCYACHPGQRAACQRDVHFANGIHCEDCHGGMAAVGDPARTPWVDEPRCDDCHSRAGFQFEQPGTLYRNSVGHRGVTCAACHGSPHAITPTVTEADNVQAILHQGFAGTISECLVCHTSIPHDPFPHAPDDD